jgi:hypothetical protein
MVRTTASTRARGPVYNSDQIIEELMKRGVSGGRDGAIRVVAICDAFTIKAEPVPNGYLTVRKHGSGYTLEANVR